MTHARPTTALRLLGAGALLLATSGCKQPGWEPPLEETSTRFLGAQVADALQSTRDARADVDRAPAQATEHLDQAVRALERMSRYYLPLLEARERAYDAHRFLYYGERQRALSEIEGVAGILDRVARSGGKPLEPAMKKPLDLVAEAKAAVKAASADGPTKIRSLAIELNFMALKGALELPDDWPQPE